MALNFAKILIKDLHHRIFGSEGRLRDLNSKTAILATNSLSSELCADLASGIDSILSVSKPDLKVWTNVDASDQRIYGFENDIEGLELTLGLEALISEIEDYLGSRINAWTIIAGRTKFKEGNKGSGGGWHRDSPFSHQVKIIWYLNNVTAENGPFEYVPDSHRNLLASDYELGEMRFEQVQEDSNMVLGSAGSRLICDTRAIHRGKPLLSGVRYSLTLYTFRRRADLENFYIKSGLAFNQ